MTNKNKVEETKYMCKFYLYKGKDKKAVNGRPWIYTDEIEEYDGE